MSQQKSSSHVQTYIKKDGFFYDLLSFEDEFPDTEYLDGAIELVIDGIQIHGFDTWDYVDFLWTALVRGMREVVRNKAYREGFPDSAIDLAMSPVAGNKVRIAIEGLTSRDASVIADQNTTFRMLCEAARAFLRKMHKRLPQHDEAMAPLNDYLDEIELAIRTTH